ncbi:unnamed protein product [Rhizophagus irregularis]|nr:unnamed protein product [Rhizophagus irregularis]
MYLLFGNKRIEDIIDGIRLEEYALLKGTITPSILKNWLEVTTSTSTTSHDKEYDIPKSPTKIDNINSSQINSSQPPSSSLPQQTNIEIIDDSIYESPTEIHQNVRSTPISNIVH